MGESSSPVPLPSLPPSDLTRPTSPVRSSIIARPSANVLPSAFARPSALARTAQTAGRDAAAVGDVGSRGGVSAAIGYAYLEPHDAAASAAQAIAELDPITTIDGVVPLEEDAESARGQPAAREGEVSRCHRGRPGVHQPTST